MGIVETRIFQLLIGAVIVEHLLEGLHRNYWTAKIKELALKTIKGGKGKRRCHLYVDRRGICWCTATDYQGREGNRARTDPQGGFEGVLYDYLECKFCQSWAMGWVVALGVILWCGVWSWDWLWMGVVMSSGANFVHGIKGWTEVAKYSPFGGKTAIVKKETG